MFYYDLNIRYWVLKGFSLHYRFVQSSLNLENGKTKQVARGNWEILLLLLIELQADSLSILSNSLAFYLVEGRY